jgi:hypothetical protein
MSFVFAKGQTQATSSPQGSGTGKPATAKMVAMHLMNMQNVPGETPASSSHHPSALPLLTGVSTAVYAQRKAAAAHNKNATVATHPYANPSESSGIYTPSATKKFQGMADSTSICPPLACQPPDQALATSTKWVFQGDNTSFAVYSPAGALQTGWPKNAQSFFGVPNPGSCDPNGPFLTDPRAFYDPNDGHFWAAILQVEGAFGINSCPFVTRYWIAVSQTSDPRGAWYIYAYDMSLGTTNAADYTQFGFDQQAIYFTGNMFDQSGSAYQYAEVLGANKSSLELGVGVSAFGFYLLSVGGVPVDTVQPMETEAHSYSGPLAGLFINSFNINFGGGQCSSGCSGVVVWAMTNPGTASTSLNGIVISTAGYSLAPNADEPGCTQCIETLDTRISGTPVYHNGFISFALETGIYNGTQVVPGIYWGQVAPVLNDNGSIANGSVYQSGYYYYGSDFAASFGALMPDADGDLFMVFEYMGSSVNPSAVYTARRVTYTPGLFHDAGIYLKKGLAATFDSRWGDYEATSYDGFSSDNVWFAGEYSASNADWSTFIGKDKFCSTCN